MSHLLSRNPSKTPDMDQSHLSQAKLQAKSTMEKTHTPGHRESVWSPHHPVGDGGLEGQPELVGSAAIDVSNRTDAVAPLGALRHKFSINHNFLQHDISRNVSQVDAEHLVVTHSLCRKKQKSREKMSRQKHLITLPNMELEELSCVFSCFLCVHVPYSNCPCGSV